MWDLLSKLLSMIRFSHTIFALPFALLAAVMAWRLPINEVGDHVAFRWLDLIGILICMVGARSAAMAFNRLVDRHIDAENPRTANRHLPAGQLSVGQVTLFIVLTSALFIGGTLLFLPNWLPLAASLPILAVLMAYSYTKRFTSLAHFWLGLSLMLAPVAAWVAVRGLAVIENPADLIPALIVGFAVMFWVAGFDIIYACQDYEFDKEAKLKSVPTWLGIKGALRLAMVSHAIMLALLVALPWSGLLAGYHVDLGWIYGIGITLVTALLVYEHAVVTPSDLTRVNVAFFNVNAIVSVGLFLIVTVDLFN